MVRGDLLGLKVHLELVISFGLDIVRDIFPAADTMISRLPAPAWEASIEK